MVDPPVPVDGTCANCGRAREPERSRKYGGPVAEADPFCSTVCCREWHAVEHSSDVPYLAPENQGRHRKGPGSVAHGTRKGYRVCACPACVEAVKGAPAPC